MAYRYEKNPITEVPELIIDGWENGIANSPYEGFSSIKNCNNRFLPGAVYSNYKRILNSTTAGTGAFTGSDSTNTLSTSVTPINVGDAFTVTGASLPGGISAGTIYYSVSGTNSSFGVSATKGGSPINISADGSGTITLITPNRATYWTYNYITNVYYILDVSGRVWESDGATTYWTLLSGNDLSGAGGQGIVFFKGYLFVFRNTKIDYCGNGTIVTQANWTNDWSPTGFSALKNQVHMGIWGQDDIMYFCNGRFVNSLQEVEGEVFVPSDANTYIYSNAALTLPSYDTATWLSELRVDLMVTAGKRIYPWDRTSTSYRIPVFIKETINKVINIMNILYVTAGRKGNIYVCNGYSISPFVKIPDSFFGIIDPQISWGDIMGHRNKLYVGACQSNPAGGVVSGIFSIDIDTKAINFENQSSFGLTGSGGLNGAPNVLIDLDMATFDSYASAWYDGTNAGMDTNTNALYSNFECAVESDLINVGDKSTPRTFSSAEFKLDEPMQSGDAIRLSVRSSFNDTYTVIGTTTSAVLSDFYQSFPVQENQWMQIKIEFKSGSTGQFVRLREVRIR